MGRPVEFQPRVIEPASGSRVPRSRWFHVALARRVGCSRPTSSRRVCSNDIRLWLYQRRQGDGSALSWATQANKLTAVRVLLAWATWAKRITMNPAAELVILRTDRFTLDITTPVLCQIEQRLFETRRCAFQGGLFGDLRR